MSVDLPETLTRLIGQHPAALRTVRWQTASLEPHELGHVELETKHGMVVVIDHRNGAIYAHPPCPPARPSGAGLTRQLRDLTADLPAVFDGRPTIQTILPILQQTGALSGWHFTLSTGIAFTLTLDDHAPSISLNTSSETR